MAARLVVIRLNSPLLFLGISGNGSKVPQCLFSLGRKNSTDQQRHPRTFQPSFPGETLETPLSREVSRHPRAYRTRSIKGISDRRRKFNGFHRSLSLPNICFEAPFVRSHIRYCSPEFLPHQHSSSIVQFVVGKTNFSAK
jgi:hypothetical protein